MLLPLLPTFKLENFLFFKSESPLHSLAQVAVAAAAAAAARHPSPSTSSHHHSQQHSSSRIATANVWVPPKVEQLQPCNTGGVSPMSTIDARKSVTPEMHQHNGLIANDRLGCLSLQL